MKRIISVVLLIAMVLFILPTDVVSNALAMQLSSDDQLNMTVHYHRFDEQYDGWNLWIWVVGKDGKSYEFNTEDAFGKKADFVIEGIRGAEEIGFIVRKGEWEAKDTDADRFVKISAVNAEGVLEIYVVQGAETVYYNESEIDLSPKFLKANFIDESTVKVVTSKPIDASLIRESFSLSTQSGSILRPTAVSSGSGSLSTNFVILLDGKALVNEKYTTNYLDYKPINVDLTGLFDTEMFENTYTTNQTLGAIYSKDQTVFRVWAPTAEAMRVNLYKAGDGGDAFNQIDMEKQSDGVWETTVSGDQDGVYYTYTVMRNQLASETYDPYATAAGVNGNRSMVVDFSKTSPEGWEKDKGPEVMSQNDVIAYEMHIRDLSQDVSSGIESKGKYLGVIEEGTVSPKGVKTGLDHLKELGITHVQILPMFDYNSVDETSLDQNQFNWGYDPKNYSVPEGSYSTDPYHGEVRVREMKQMIQGLHNDGIGVIMDVVYNHTALSDDSNFSIIEPGYYYRMVDGKYSNASGTGNEIASERAMVKKMIIDSLVHWVSEYHIDGFRFDLMGVLDIETMNEIESTLRAINPDIILYGEGWTGGSSPLPENQRLIKANMNQAPMIGAFCDDMRDGIKGHVFHAEEGGFAGGISGLEESVKFGIVGSVMHDQINYKEVNYSKKPWAVNPSQSVNYVSAHDNLTLWDKFAVTNPDATELQRIEMDKLSNAIVLTSQGMPFLHAGVDFLRTKDGDENSYKSSDEINALDWSLKEQHSEVFNYYKGLIAVRKAYPAFSLDTQEEIQNRLHFFSTDANSEVVLHEQMIGYKIDANKAMASSTSPSTSPSNSSQDVYVFFNGNLENKNVTLPEGHYKVLVNHKSASPEGVEYIEGGVYEMPASSALILEVSEVSQVSGNTTRVIVIVGFGCLLGIIILVVIARKKSKK